MKIDALTIFMIGSIVSLVIERIYYYRLKYRGKDDEGGNPGYGERIAALEKGQGLQEKSNEKDHGLMRTDIGKIFNILDRMKK